MPSICSMTIVRDGEEYIEQCLRQIAPYVSRMKVAIDSRSKDRTREIVRSLSKDFPIEMTELTISDPTKDLVTMRNTQLLFTEKWGFIVDADEFHYDIASYTFTDADAYGFMCHAPWNMEEGHKASGRALIGRVFRNYGTLEWKGLFGKEKLFRDGQNVFDTAELLPYRYLHLTHLKHDPWREEMNQKRIADGRALYRLPERIISLLKDIHEKVPTL